MSLHAYVDESVRRNHYLICATTIAIQDRGAAQKALRGLRSSGQRRIHFVDESDRRRRTILAAIAKLETSTVVYIAQDRNQVTARTAILQTMVPDLRGRGVTRLLLDSRQGQDGKDRSTIHQAASKDPRSFSYAHQQSTSEPLLWVPDAIAWAWGRGGDWRRRCTDLGLVTGAITVSVP